MLLNPGDRVVYESRFSLRGAQVAKSDVHGAFTRRPAEPPGPWKLLRGAGIQQTSFVTGALTADEGHRIDCSQILFFSGAE